MKIKYYIPFLFLGLLTVNNSSAQNYIITTVAGDGTRGFSGDGGPATSAELYNVLSVVADANGNVYVADNNSARVRKVNTNGIISTYAGTGSSGYTGDGGPSSGAELVSPTGLFVDGFNNLYIADAGTQTIREINTSGIITTVAGNGNSGYTGDGGQATMAQLSGPTGVAVDANGNIYIADRYNQVIRKVNANGIISTIAGNGQSGYSGDNGPATIAELSYPYGVGLDGNGNVYIADNTNNRIRMVNTSGVITTVAGTGAAGYSGDGGQATDAIIWGPTGVTADAGGNLYISGFYGSNIRKVNTSGIIYPIAGNQDQGYSGDGGIATNAELWAPYGVSLDNYGNVYIADNDNFRARKLTVASGVNDLATNKERVTTYPNPSNGYFTINFEIALDNSRVEVFNSLGQLIYTAALNPLSTKINLNNPASGIYFYRIINEQNNLEAQGKFVVE